MTKEITININNEEIMSLEQLDAVAGGTVDEFDELVTAFAKHPALKHAVGLAVHVPGANELTTDLVQRALYQIGIEADIDLGLCGTGIMSKPNKYTSVATGASLSHEEVLARIKRSSDDAYKSIGL